MVGVKEIKHLPLSDTYKEVDFAKQNCVLNGVNSTLSPSLENHEHHVNASHHNHTYITRSLFTCRKRLLSISSNPKAKRRFVFNTFDHIDRLRKLDLSIRNTDDLEFSYSKLLCCVAKLISCYPQQIYGGVVVIEATYNGSTFNLHAHIVFQGEWIPVDHIRHYWNQITRGEGQSVNIEMVVNRGRYINYITKSIDMRYWSKEAKAEWYGVMDRKPLLFKFGRLRLDIRGLKIWVGPTIVSPGCMNFDGLDDVEKERQEEERNLNRRRYWARKKEIEEVEKKRNLDEKKKEHELEAKNWSDWYHRKRLNPPLKGPILDDFV